VDVPPEYHGREQSWLKHRILSEYLQAWAHKMGSKATRLWYVDVFAGPWQSKDADLRDTSIWIGLAALEEAARSWQALKGVQIEVGAVFVEKNRKAFDRLRDFLNKRGGIVETHPYFGEFGDHVESIQALLGQDPAFVFVDPTGFKGVEMQFIAPLVEPRYRDVLINVMFNDVNRWKDDPREFLRQQMRAFFGLEDADLPRGLLEPELLRIYREQLKSRSKVCWAADLAVPHPTMNRTWFRLVVAGQHTMVLDVFRAAERKIIGAEADLARTGAKIRSDDQPWLFSAQEATSGEDLRYAKQRAEDLERVLPMVGDLLADGDLRWNQIWPRLLEELHLAPSDVSARCFEAFRAGQLGVSPTPSPRRRALHEDDLISIGTGAAESLDGDDPS
jgi:three-Cys-motif partner protein